MLMNNINWDEAKGARVKINGEWYIDFTSSIFTQNFGHNNPYITKEVKKQLKKCSHAYGYNTEIKEKYINQLKYFTGYKNILLFSTGAEAIEATIKICLNNGYSCIGIKDAMHGRTLGAEALVGKRNVNDIQTIEKITNVKYYKKAIFVEGYRGYDCKLLNKEEIEDLQLNRKNNLIIFDEIQSGFYRTNERFVNWEYNIFPDILVTGKSMGGGFPLSAVCYNKDLNLNGIELSSTHSGQPLQMAAGYGVLKYLKNKMDVDKYTVNINCMNLFWNSLKVEHNNLGMVGAFKAINENYIYNTLFRHKLLVTKTGKGWIKIAPPININYNLLKERLELIKRFL